MNRKYETLVVLTTQIGEKESAEEIQKIQALLEAQGATNINIDKWGRKEIAYLVKKQKHGNYVVFNFEADSSSIIDTLSRSLSIMDAVLKFQTHKINDRRRKFKGNPRIDKSSDFDSDESDDSMAEADF